MLLSIIMPMRNAEKYVKQALLSIINNGYDDIEIVVIDDCSTDSSLDIIKSIADERINIIPGDCKGISFAINKAIENCRGEIIMRCDADDLYIKDRIAWQVKWLSEHYDYVAVCANYMMIDKKDKTVNDIFNTGKISQDITDELRSGKCRTHLCTYAIRANALEKIGGAREFFVSAEDIDIQLRLSEVGKVWYEHKLSYLYRIHDDSITHTQVNTERNYYEQMARNLQIQRLASGMDDLQRGIQLQLPEHSDCSMRDSSQHITEMFIASAWLLSKKGKKKQAINKIFKAISVKPFNYRLWKYLAIMILR